jgi:hypothetical protein
LSDPEKEDSAKAQEYLDASQQAAKDLVEKEEKLVLAEDAYLAKWIKLYEDNAVYCMPAANQEIIEDAVADEINEKLTSLNNNERLLEDGTVIKDFVGVSYYIKENGKWDKKVIDEVGVTVPEGALMEEDLTSEMREEILYQAELERIAALSAEEKEKEKESAIALVKSEARLKKEEADIADEVFDAKAWFGARKDEIEAKYA